ncbi:MAG: KH domain-containing protein [Ruminococcaceae bacterium]|nr:KH domain-containing protein [Oscillospiraceae bacterium]MBO4972839.1 KH domain-containing protein [Clostridia bacterium]
MKKKITVSAKSMEEATLIAAEQLSVSAELLSGVVVTEPKKGFLGIGGSLGEYSFEYGKDNADKAMEFIANVLKNMGLENAKASYNTELYNTTNELAVVIEGNGDDVGVLIGHHGETLDSLQYLSSLAANRRENDEEKSYSKLTLDIEGYRAKREATLKALAVKKAEQVLKYKKSVILEPMNPYERKIIHSTIQEIEGVSTNSIGSENNRKVVVFLDATKN